MGNYHSRKADEYEAEAARLLDAVIFRDDDKLIEDSVIVSAAQAYATLALSHRTADNHVD